jgi:phosphatidate cytidylyltransferase
MIIFICVFTDIGGYVFGNFFKGPKLTKLSPNKTYSGVIGGYLFSIIFMALFFNYADNISEIINIKTTAKKLSSNYFILTIFISTVSQLGDIFVSYFKRKSKIKDTGKIIPGHGGLLDRIDGMIFAFPATYLISKVIY